jgi:hypothetical protein
MVSLMLLGMDGVGRNDIFQKRDGALTDELVSLAFSSIFDHLDQSRF